MTAKERAERWDARWTLCGDFDREAFADLITTIRAHANAALEEAARAMCPHCAAGLAVVIVPSGGVYHHQPGSFNEPPETFGCHAAAILALREEE